MMPSFPRARQGLIVRLTLLTRWVPAALLALALGLAAWGGGGMPRAWGQDDLDIPGLTDQLLPDPPASPAGEGAAVQGDTSLLGLIAAGGWAMSVLILFSIGLVGLAVYCALDLRQRNFCPEDLRGRLREGMESADLPAVNAALEGNGTTLARMTAAMAAHVGETGYSTEDNDLLRDMMAEAGLKHNRTRARVINYFSVLAQASPMMGLLGTVSGMIKAFGTLGTQGMGDPAALAANISEALVTTAAGLVIALPAIFLYFFFRDRLEELITLCEDSGVELLVSLRRAAWASAAPAAGEEAPDAPPEPDL